MRHFRRILVKAENSKQKTVEVSYNELQNFVPLYEVRSHVLHSRLGPPHSVSMVRSGIWHAGHSISLLESLLRLLVVVCLGGAEAVESEAGERQG